jgi:sec-independent protein translocase protein TatA
LGEEDDPVRLPFRAVSTPGATELLIVLVIVLLILGPKRLPSLGRQLGGGIREFRRSLGGGDTGEERDATRVRETDATVDPTAPAATGDPAADGRDAERRTV